MNFIIPWIQYQKKALYPISIICPWLGYLCCTLFCVVSHCNEWYRKTGCVQINVILTKVCYSLNLRKDLLPFSLQRTNRKSATRSFTSVTGDVKSLQSLKENMPLLRLVFVKLFKQCKLKIIV